MNKISKNLLVGEKIGFGFGLVGLIFLIVIWQYHSTLQQSLDDYQHLQDVVVAKKVGMLEIQSSMRSARQAEKEFLLYRGDEYSRKVDQQLQDSQLSAEELGKIDPESAEIAEQIISLLDNYQQKFQATVQAWRKKGLDHNSGLQGAFRNAVHELETMSGYFKVDQLYLQLLQIRRSEKDLGLRREQQYFTRVIELVQELDTKIAQSELEEGVKTQLFHETETYRTAFKIYASEALANSDIHGGKGAFRQAAHRIEAILNDHLVSDLAISILQLRRREKDYLLRHDKKYVDMALQELNRIHTLVETSTISSEHKSHFLNLLENYNRDFLALVEQNDQIESLKEDMRVADSEISVLVEDNVAAANQFMRRMEREISISVAEKERFMLWSVFIATLLGIIFAVSITRHIVRPLRSMTGILDRLAYEEPSERLPFHPGARNEVNAMAMSVNTMADNRSRFIDWWKSSMREADACEKLEKILQQAADKNELDDVELQFRDALTARHELLFQQYHKLHDLNSAIITKAEALQQGGLSGQTYIDVTTIRYSSRSMQNILEMIAFQEHQEKNKT